MRIEELLKEVVEESIKKEMIGKATTVKIKGQEYYISFCFREIDTVLEQAKEKAENAKNGKEFFKVFEDFAKKKGFDLKKYSEKLAKRFD